MSYSIGIIAGWIIATIAVVWLTIKAIKKAKQKKHEETTKTS